MWPDNTGIQGKEDYVLWVAGLTGSERKDRKATTEKHNEVNASLFKIEKSMFIFVGKGKEASGESEKLNILKESYCTYFSQYGLKNIFQPFLLIYYS